MDNQACRKCPRSFISVTMMTFDFVVVSYQSSDTLDHVDGDAEAGGEHNKTDYILAWDPGAIGPDANDTDQFNQIRKEFFDRLEKPKNGRELNIEIKVLLN